MWRSRRKQKSGELLSATSLATFLSFTVESWYDKRYYTEARRYEFLCSSDKRNITLVSPANEWDIVFATRTDKICILELMYNFRFFKLILTMTHQSVIKNPTSQANAGIWWRADSGEGAVEITKYLCDQGHPRYFNSTHTFSEVWL